MEPMGILSLGRTIKKLSAVNYKVWWLDWPGKSKAIYINNVKRYKIGEEEVVQ